MLVILSGSSGIGKSTIINAILDRYDKFNLMPTYTTRKMRSDESHGNPYYFISIEEFEKRKKNGEFLEWEEVHGNYYATSKLVIQQMSGTKILIKDIDVKGAMNLQEKLDDVIVIFLKASSFSKLQKRLEERGESDIEKRLARYQLELDFSKKFIHILINDDMDTTINKIMNIISLYDKS